MIILSAVSLVSLGIIAAAFAAVVGGVIALLKFKPEKTEIIVKAASGLVVVQSDVIERQDVKIATLESRIDVLEAREEEAKQLKDVLEAVMKERDELREANESLHAERVTWKAERVDLREELTSVKTHCVELQSKYDALSQLISNREQGEG